MIDEVAVKQALLKNANAQGSLSNEEAFRASIEKFQGNVRDHTPLIVDVSSSAEKRFALDMANLEALAQESLDPQMRRIAEITVRSLKFLARTKDNN
jgi:hypothetical protein